MNEKLYLKVPWGIAFNVGKKRKKKYTYASKEDTEYLNVGAYI